MRKFYDWHEVQRYYDEGHGWRECIDRFGFCYGSWKKAIERGDLKLGDVRFGDLRRRIDWTAVQEYYDAGHSLRQCQTVFKFSNAAWHKAVRRGEIKPRTNAMTIAELLQRGVSRYNIKQRLLRTGLLSNACAQCGLTKWRGERLSLHIDHINGVKNDHRLENLRMLCPNCHSQTVTYGGRNMKRRRLLQEREALT